jgi:hypothetical protein
MQDHAKLKKHLFQEQEQLHQQRADHNTLAADYRQMKATLHCQASAA